MALPSCLLLTFYRAILLVNAAALLGLGILAVWMHRAPARIDQRQTMTSARGALHPLNTAPTRPQGGGINGAQVLALVNETSDIVLSASGIARSARTSADSASSLSHVSGGGARGVSRHAGGRNNSSDSVDGQSTDSGNRGTTTKGT